MPGNTSEKPTEKKIFLDTSILITALLSSKGGSFYLLARYYNQLDFYINEYVLEEALEVLQTKFSQEKELRHNLYLLLGFSRIEVLPNPTKNKIKKLQGIINKEDVPILASAIDNCDILLTLDNDFLIKRACDFGEEEGIKILKPKAFIDLLKEQPINGKYLDKER